MGAFVKLWEKPPARLVMFRDGLSEGEWEGVGALEIKAIEGMSRMKAFSIQLLILIIDTINEFWDLKKPPFPKPKLAYIVVGKRYISR